ncbi:DUF2500 domain-containing protein [Paenibacillus alba]|uniref:DUF2500 domain-containing protein n=1 Tax=Paenibacillus alba TaxID=1197127 RepID=A0ABU6FXZ5_9BACL|nr:DUF2500 domain-containing protein [Paenibacillus alba]MEC0226591.1 DUF2500 domain-containing protein [Paenibacillus alba]
MPTGFNTGFFSMGSNIFFTVFILIFVLVIGGFIFIIIKSLSTWVSNNASPLQSRTCKVVAKRMQVSGGSGDSTSSTSYYATFEFEDRSRLELYIGRQQFGYIVEGDLGTLSYQGTRYKAFSRLL